MTERPRLERAPVEMPVLFGAGAAVWHAVCALADALTEVPWTIVGGQMVYLLGVEHGVEPHRVTTDIDAAVDLRAAPNGVKALVVVLTALDFEPTVPSPDGHAYHFERNTTAGVAAVDVVADQEDDHALVVDVLAPEGLGPRADLSHAFPAKGVSQALDRTELLPIRVAAQVHWVPRPNLLGAIVGKATASVVDTKDPTRHRLDLAFLCGLVADPFMLAAEVTKKDRDRLRQASAAFDESDPSWRTAANPTDAQLALEILIGDAPAG